VALAAGAGLLWREELVGGRHGEPAGSLASRLDLDYELLCRKRILHLMMPEEAAELPSAGVSVQLHTHRHRTPLQRELFLREIDENRQRVIGITGQPTRHFCYPNGFLAPEFIPWLRDSGVEYATTCQTDISTRDSEPLLLPRFVDGSQMTAADFATWISGLAPALRGIARRALRMPT